MLPLLIPLFFWKITFFLKKKKLPFSFVHPFFVKLFLFHLLCCVAPFPVCFCFFNRALSNKINWPFFLLAFAFLSFFFSLISPFFLFISISVCVSLSLHDRGQNTSPREMSADSGGNGHQCLKKRSLAGVLLSMTEGLSWWTWINQGECLGWWFLARFGSNGVFLVI